MVFIPTTAFKNILAFCDDRIEREQRAKAKTVMTMVSIVRRDVEEGWAIEGLEGEFYNDAAFNSLFDELREQPEQVICKKLFYKLDAKYLKTDDDLEKKYTLTWENGLLIPDTM